MTLEELFPGLRHSAYQITSPVDRRYNCISWSVRVTDQWLWPGPLEDSDWPADITREETIAAFESLFAWFGFSPCAQETAEPGTEKVALFATPEGVPTHAARQLPSGRWTSKLGHAEDIEHDLHAIAGDEYGQVVRLFRRPAPS